MKSWTLLKKFTKHKLGREQAKSEMLSKYCFWSCLCFRIDMCEVNISPI